MAKTKTRPSGFAMTPWRPQPQSLRIVVPKAAPIAKTRKKGSRRGHGKGRSATGGSLIEMTIAAGVVGMADKAGIIDKVPNVPVIGRKGAAAIALHFFMPHNPYAKKPP